jgi:hypothetical protein
MTDQQNSAKHNLARYLNSVVDLENIVQQRNFVKQKIGGLVVPLRKREEQSTRDKNANEELMAELLDLTRMHEAKYKESVAICADIERHIQNVGGLHGMILFKRYCELKEWSVICCEVRAVVVNGGNPFLYDDRTMYRKHDEALSLYGKGMEMRK